MAAPAGAPKSERVMESFSPPVWSRVRCSGVVSFSGGKPSANRRTWELSSLPFSSCELPMMSLVNMPAMFMPLALAFWA